MNAQKKNIEKPYSSQLMFFGGIGLCLFSIILVMNVGAIARVFTFPFTYAFGICSYFIYGTIYIVGILLLFASNKLKIKHKIRIVGYVLSFLSLLILISQIYCSIDGVMLGVNNVVVDGVTTRYNFHDYFNTVTKIPSNYINESFVDMFVSYRFAGGYFGYALVGVLNEFVGVALTYIISCLILIVGIVLIFLPNIIAFYKDRKYRINNQVSQEFYSTNDTLTLETSSAVNKKHSLRNKRIENIDVVKGASRLNDSPPIIPLANKMDDINPLDNEVKAVETVKQEPVVNKNPIQYEELSTFRYARFNRGVVASNDLPNNMHAADAPFEKAQIVEEIIPEAPKEINREQLTLGFDVEEEKDEKFDILPEPEQVVNIYQNKVETQESIDNVSIPEHEEIKPTTRVENTIQVTPSVVNKPVVNQTSVDNNTNNNVKKPVQKAPQSVAQKQMYSHIKYIPPGADLLISHETQAQQEINQKNAEEKKVLINEAFKEFNVNAFTNNYVIGPSVTRFNIEYGQNVSANSVNRLIDDISIRLGGVDARFEMIIEGERYSGLEIPNVVSTIVGFKEAFLQLPDVKKHPTSVPFGVNIAGNVICADFADFPHLLVAGSTGSGKSVYLHSIFLTLIMRNSPEDLRLLVVDPKAVEMAPYEGIPHLVCPIISDYSEANVALNKMVDEMERRYAVFKQTGMPGSITSLKEYNEYARANNLLIMPRIICFVDEYGDLVSNCREFSQPIIKLSQKSRACGIHLLIATQRPSANVITGVIKSNLPTKVALRAANITESMVLVDKGGAEKLLGNGDMLVASPLISRVGLVRLQGCFVQKPEIIRVANYLKERYPVEYFPEFLDLVDHSKEDAQASIRGGEYGVGDVTSFDNDEKYKEIKGWVMTQEFVSMSKIQRECYVGFNKAGKIMKRLQADGIIASEAEGASKGCRVLVHMDGDDGYNDNIPTSDEMIS